MLNRQSRWNPIKLFFICVISVTIHLWIQVFWVHQCKLTKGTFSWSVADLSWNILCIWGYYLYGFSGFVFNLVRRTNRSLTSFYIHVWSFSLPTCWWIQIGVLRSYVQSSRHGWMAEDYGICTTSDENLHEFSECRNIDQVVTYSSCEIVQGKQNGRYNEICDRR